MLGHPEVDPHGDPIPNAEGVVTQRELHSLLTCPLGVPLVGHARRRSGRGVSPLPRAQPPEAGTRAARRVARRGGRQRARALQGRRAAHHWRPGGVEAAGGSAVGGGVRAGADHVGGGAAARRRRAAPSLSRSPTTRSSSKRPSTRKPRVFQNIVGVLFGEDSGAWAITFTQEWPAPSMKHQLSYTVSAVQQRRRDRSWRRAAELSLSAARGRARAARRCRRGCR